MTSETTRGGGGRPSHSGLRRAVRRVMVGAMAVGVLLLGAGFTPSPVGRAMAQQPPPAESVAPMVAERPARDRRPHFRTRARYAVILDARTGRILFARRADQPASPASLTKLMTAYVVFQAIEDGEIALSDRVRVSARAAAAIGSSMGLRAGDQPTIDELLKGTLIRSGNDATRALAEAVSGGEQAFAQRMTALARAIGMRSARFQNSSGLPRSNHRVSARDVAVLALRILDEFPEHRGYFTAASYGWRGGALPNRNPLIAEPPTNRDWVADGMKTGYTAQAGYAIVATAVDRRGRRVVVVLIGLRSEAERRSEAIRAIDWAFRAL